MNENDMIYTDLALETSEMVREKDNVEIEGVTVEVDYNEEKDVKITMVEVCDDNGERVMGKPKGKYITIESDKIDENDINKHKEISKILAVNMKKLVNLDNKKQQLSVLIVGLGNPNVSADSLGPKVANNIIITRHLFIYMPNELDENVFGNVSSITPGVMGTTGMETSEIIKGIVEKTKPDLVIVIDSLAARNASRINKTIQITDTGIHPGSGVGNKRKIINEESLGTKVVAIGVPTVVNALTLINDIEISIMNNKKFKVDKEKYTEFENLCVTPKEEDVIMERLKTIITNGLNLYLHEGLDIDEIKDYMY